MNASRLLYKFIRLLILHKSAIQNEMQLSKHVKLIISKIGKTKFKLLENSFNAHIRDGIGLFFKRVT